MLAQSRRIGTSREERVGRSNGGTRELCHRTREGHIDENASRRDLGIGTGSFESLHIPVITADDVARHVLFYASDVSAPANGTTAVLDFGYAVRSSFPPIHFV